ncbi:uncharacterized protein KD926_010992 [Aspergillus affinis]|uniref:uncharacterized protein n=1 Tax=Aspergillus affinis TaxID=1070780 RepID=UPI0022FDBA5F|nr:uncharacterized protein KD926_010992 [Aspergillus affinis]KAI9044820.1 hypothetical protein KD926_010992 [Aspergillus affinis]
MADKITEAATLMPTTAGTRPENVKIASWIFNHVGEVHQISESSSDMQFWLSAPVRDLVVNNAIEMMKLVPSGEHRSVLREKIASLGGASIRALLELEKLGVRSAFTTATMAAAERFEKQVWEKGGVLLEAEAGDVFIIPAGVAHKTHNTKPEAEFALLSPGTGHGIEASGGDWDFVATGGDFERVWSVPKPRYDSVLGSSERGLCKTWRGSDSMPRSHL